ncbi:MAG TPA: hypothetical protein VI685_08205, partial [Candidatus Angelobacter sp.]
MNLLGDLGTEHGKQATEAVVTGNDFGVKVGEAPIEPYRTMVVVAQCLGLRVSEILALQWPDINFAEL